MLLFSVSVVPPTSNPFMGTGMPNQAASVASNPFLTNAVSTSTAMPQSNGMFGGQFAASQPAAQPTSVPFGGAPMQPATSAAYAGAGGGFPNQARQMNGGVGTGFGQVPTAQGQFAAQGHFAAQGQFPATSQAQFPTPQQQGQFPNQFNMQPAAAAAQGQFPPVAGFGAMPQQQQPQQQNMSFGGAGMTAMAGMQFQKQIPGQQPGGAGQLGGFGVGAQGQQQATFSASWGGTMAQQQQPAMNSNPFLASTDQCQGAA